MLIFADIFNQEFLLGSEGWGFLGNIAIRTLVMFLVIIVAIKVLGKRGVKQLSIFELVVIIGLGSAAGDPMLYREIGIISAIMVFIVVIFSYRLITFLIGKFRFFENFFEGTPTCVVENGEFAINNFKKEALGSEELISALREKGISQLGQVELAIEEISGEFSVFFYNNKDVKYGLPILPGSSDRILKNVQKEGYYACRFCGHTEFKSPGHAGKCPICEHEKWIEASNKKRVS